PRRGGYGDGKRPMLASPLRTTLRKAEFSLSARLACWGRPSSGGGRGECRSRSVLFSRLRFSLPILFMSQQREPPSSSLWLYSCCSGSASSVGGVCSPLACSGACLRACRGYPRPTFAAG